MTFSLVQDEDAFRRMLLSLSAPVQCAIPRLSVAVIDLSSCEVLRITHSVTLRAIERTTIICPRIEIAARRVKFKRLVIRGSVHITSADFTVISDCTVQDAGPGQTAFILISDSRSVSLRQVTVTGSGDSPGVYLRHNSCVTAENVIVRGLQESLLVVNTWSTLTARDSTFSGSQANLIYASANASLVMVNCEFSNGAFPGIYVQEGKCSIQNSRFRAMTQNGISLNKVTNFVIENSEFDEVQGSAIAIVDQSTGLIRNNRLQKIGGNSLYISGDSNVTIEGNVIEGGEYPAIAVLLSSSAVVRGNTVREMACSSVCIRGAKTAVIDQLTIVNSRECGISVSDSQSCVIENSIFQGCAFAGIECYNWSDVTVKHSTLRNCKIGFAVYAEGKLTAVENNAIGISDHLASLTFHGSAIISQTECTEVAALADVKTARLCVFQGNGTFPDCTNDQTKANELGIVFLQPWAEPAPKRCLKCNTANRDVFLMPCGHMIYCQSCAAAAKDASEVCPICRFPISAATPGFPAAGEDVCMICSEGAPTCMIVPCGHRGFCRACLDKWYKCHHFCPACRAEPSSFKEIITDL